MNERDIERGLAELRDTWRTPGAPPPLDRMWETIEREAFAVPVRTPFRWTRTILPLAAMLLLGFGIGQVAPRLGAKAGANPAETSVTPVQAASEAAPFVGVATDYLERVTALLVTLANESGRGQPAQYSASQARDLLATTRLLMDTPFPVEPHLRSLLEDLELVLAQIARLPARPEPPDVYLIDQALDQREVISRLRVYLAETPHFAAVNGGAIFMRPLQFLFCASLLVPVASAQTPVPPRPKPAPRPQVAPLPSVRPPAHGLDLFGYQPMAALPVMPHFELFGHQSPSFEFDFGHQFDFDFDHQFNFDFDHQLNYEDFGHQFEMLQGIPTPKSVATPSAPWGAMSTVPTPGMFWSGPNGTTGGFERFRPEQGSPEDSLYRRAREALNRGEYSQASTLFQSLEQRYPRSRVAPAALYYRAFALYRAGGTDELRAAVEALRMQQERYPEAATDPDAATLRTRLYAALAARGDAQAANALRAATAGGPSCDKEDVEVRAEALNALAQINPPEARPTLKKVLARRDECSVRLRRSAVYILGRSGTEESAADLLEVAKTDPDASVRSDAIVLLGRSSGTATVKTLETIFNEATDDRTRQAALSALKNKGGPEAKRVLKSIIERNDVNERMRTEAISQLASSSNEWRMLTSAVAAQEAATVSGQRRSTLSTGDEEDAAYLRGLYAKTDSPALKSSIISAVARMGGTTNEQWILGIVRNKDESVRSRREALSRLKAASLSVDDLGKLFDSLSERDLRSAVVNQLASREEPAALDKLVEIIKSGTDPQIRREAIQALARRKDPRATKLLLDLVEKP